MCCVVFEILQSDDAVDWWMLELEVFITGSITVPQVVCDSLASSQVAVQYHRWYAKALIHADINGCLRGFDEASIAYPDIQVDIDKDHLNIKRRDTPM